MNLRGLGWYRGGYGGLSENDAEIKIESLMFSDSAFYADSKYVRILMCLILIFWDRGLEVGVGVIKWGFWDRFVWEGCEGV